MPKKQSTNQNKKPRTVKQPIYKSFRLQKKIKPPAKKPLPGIVRLCRSALVPLKSNKKLFFGIIFIHFVFIMIFVSGIASSLNFVAAKDSLQQAFGGTLDNYTSVVALLSYALSSGGGGNTASANYQIFISLVVSLAVIWSIRQVLAGEKIIIRQAFYLGMYPLIPFMAVLLIIGLQLIPALIGNLLLTIVLSGGLAVTLLEKALFWLIFILLSLLSLYMLVSSIFGLYISTLPDMTPLKALRSARSLVLHRRLRVALRLVGLPLVMMIFYAVVLVPLIFIFPLAVVPVFLLLNSFSLFFINSYLYNLYRELL